MKKFIPIKDAVEYCEEENCLLPSAFLSVFPNNFGINLCSISGFWVELTEDGQYKSIEVVFDPVPDPQFDHTWALEALEDQGI